MNEPDGPPDEFNFKVVVTGDQPGQLTIELSDAKSVFDPQTRFPPKTLPNSLAYAIEMTPLDLTYDGKAGSKVFMVQFKPKPNLKKQFYQGFISISFGGGDSDASAQSSVGALKPLIVAPYGAVDTLSLGQFQASQIGAIRVSPIWRSSFLDALLPDIPGILNYGPARIDFSVTNPGEMPSYTRVTLEMQGSEGVLFKQTIPRKLTIGGEVGEYNIETTFEDENTNRTINALPSMGVFRLAVSASSELSGVARLSSAQASIVVLQWKEPFAAISVVVFIFWLIRRLRKARRPKAQFVVPGEPSASS